MNGFVFEPQDDLAKWVADGIGIEAFAMPLVAFGYVVDGKLVNCAVFNNWNLSNVEMHFRSDGRLRRAFMVGCYDYCFGRLAAERVEAKTRRSNKKAQQTLIHVGFKFEATLKRYYGPDRKDDAIVFRLFKDDPIKWIRNS